MEVQVISESVQKFNGVTYYSCGNYYQRKGVRLHRAVWEYHNGKIPDGFHIHHKDGNRSNNQIENLEMLSRSDHLSFHMNKPERIEKSKKDVKIAIEAARKWHGTDEGYAFHSELAKNYWENAPQITYTCDFCGKEFQSRKVMHKGNHFCHQNCKAKFRTRRIRLENQERNKSGKS